jgi:predicted nucleic acid-binding protein
VIVADASPLIGLARLDLLPTLRQLYETVLIPPRVLSELSVASDRPGARRLETALAEGWLKSTPLARADERTVLHDLLDAGEAEAILLAEERAGSVLRIDDRRGRMIARARGIPVVGTGGVLLFAKREGLIERLGPEIDRLAEAGYRLSPGLRDRLLKLAGEQAC